MKYLYTLLLILFLPLVLIAQDSMSVSSYFQTRDFGQYFVSDSYAPITNVGLGYMWASSDYDIADEPRTIVPVIEPIVGVQIPIYYYSDERQKLAVSFPISFSVWFDFTEQRTSPILNTDYRFALMEFNYSRKLNNGSLKNIGVRFVPFAHESTHVGDELLISKFKDTIPGSRVNVSYETIELGLHLNDPYGQMIKNHSFRLGAKFLWNPVKGYYTTDPFESTSDYVIRPSERWIEPYVQYQYQNPDGWLSGEHMMFMYSLHLNLRVKYGYPFHHVNNEGVLIRHDREEAYHLCATSMLGWQMLKEDGSQSNFGVFFKLYMGLNPHGQFRNIPRYPWTGLSLVYGI